MTHNFLTILTNNIDVEYLFNSSWDVCHYCWNCLNSNTIEMIMLIKWYEKLELWKFEKNSNSSNKKKKTETKTDEIWIDEQSVTIIQEMIEWETESNDESMLDIDDE